MVNVQMENEEFKDFKFLVETIGDLDLSLIEAATILWMVSTGAQIGDINGQRETTGKSN